MDSKESIEEEIKYLWKANEDVLRLHPEAAAEFSSPEGVIERQDDALYKLPDYAKKILKNELADLYPEIVDLIAQIKDTNESYIDEPVPEVHVLLNGDPFILDIRDRLINWANKYCLARIKKTKQHYDEHPLKHFARVINEFPAYFGKLYDSPRSVHPLFLLEINIFIVWTLYKHTWNEYVCFDHDPGNECKSIYFGNILRGYENIYQPILSKCRLLSEYRLEYFVDYIAKQMKRDDKIARLSDESKLGRLHNMASDLIEMKPLLISKLHQNDYVLSLSPKLYLRWSWGSEHTVGEVSIARSEEELWHLIDTQQHLLPIRLEHSGMLHHGFLPWLKIDGIKGKDYNPLDIGMALIMPVHDKLFSYYDKIDLDAILNNNLAPDSTLEGEAQISEEVVAASCQRLFPETGEDAKSPFTSVGRGFVHKIRSQRLFRILERLGCEVKYGKGSEVTIFRRGGRKYRVGHHKANDYVSPFVIKYILDRVSVSQKEWLQAIQ